MFDAIPIVDVAATLLRTQYARIVELEKERDALKADACRYRWLRAASAFPAGYVEVNGEIHDDRTLDAAIDAARTTGEQK